VHREVTTVRAGAAELLAASWLRVRRPRNVESVRRLSISLQAGESEAIVLAVELGVQLLVDDRAARRAAGSLGISHTGTLGLLVRAKDLGVIQQVRPLVDDLLDAGAHFGPGVIRTVLSMAGENT
jgi:uncharacterized protein